MSREQDFLQALMQSSAKLAEITASLPVCPTCGGTKNVWGPGGVVHGTTIEACPENDGHCDGRVTVERMAKMWEAVHGDEGMVITPRGPGIPNVIDAVLDHLRAIR